MKRLSRSGRQLLHERTIMSVGSKLRSLVYSKGVNSLPMATLIILFLVYFFISMTVTMCFSYLPKLVKTFGISEVNTGRYAGYLASSVYLGWIVCGYASGYLADLKGHKLILLLCISGMIVATLLFGFSSNFYWALCVRIMQGLCLGSLGICKAILSIACDETNITLAFTIFFTSITSAFLVGPIVSGYLAFPAEQYSDVFSKDSIFGMYGILLPNLVLAVCLTITLLLAIVCLPSNKRTGEEDNIVEKEMEKGERIRLLPNDSVGEKKIYSSTATTAEINSTTMAPNGLRKLFSLCKRRELLVCILLYSLSGFAIIGVEEIFPVFAATVDTYKGLGLSTSQIGTILLASSVFLFIVQVTVTGKISHRYGSRKTFIWCSMLMMVTVPVFPTTYVIHRNKAAMTAYAIVVMSVNQILINAILININVLINKSVTQDVFGAANGIALTGFAIGKALSPTVLGSLFSWSLTNIKGVKSNVSALGFPFDQYFTFIVTGLVFMFCALIASLGLSPSPPKTHEEPEETDKSDVVETKMESS